MFMRDIITNLDISHARPQSRADVINPPRKGTGEYGKPVYGQKNTEKSSKNDDITANPDPPVDGG